MIISSHSLPAHFSPAKSALKTHVDNSQVNKESTDNNGQKTNNESKSVSDSERGNGNLKKVESELEQQELSQLRELRQRDREVRAHEQAHAAVAGSLAKGAPSYSFQRGPDGQLYAIGGEVKIDTSAVAGDPQATAEKARQVRRTALAPAEPSSQDRAVAAAAAALEAQARVEMAQEKTEDGVAKLNDKFSQEQNNSENRSENKVNETINPEVHSKCAQCGGQHSAESHSVSIILNQTFDPVDEKAQQKNQFNIAI